MGSVTTHVDVDVPIRTVYDQWTQFEEFPQFMEGVQQVRQISDTMTHWTVEIDGVTREFDAKISEQLPDERVAWHSTNGSDQSGVVTFHRIDPDCTRVTLQLEFDPHGVVEKAGDKLGFVQRRAKGDLERFKTFIERRGQETGAWRGKVERPVP